MDQDFVLLGSLELEQLQQANINRDVVTLPPHWQKHLIGTQPTSSPSPQSGKAPSKPGWSSRLFPQSQGAPAQPFASHPEPIIPSQVSEKQMREHLATVKISTTEPKVLLKPRGLNNSKNKCFINSVLQALFICTPFRNFIADLKTYPSPLTEFPYLARFVKFYNDISGNFNHPLTPDFNDTLPAFCQRTGLLLHDQQDAQEYLEFLLEHLNTELTYVKGSTIPPFCNITTL